MRYLAILLCLTLASCGTSKTRSHLKTVQKHHDPATMPLEPAYNQNVRSTHVDSGAVVGIIHLQDGSSAKFWFRSHHQSGDLGGTLFEMSDGTERFMAGYFCCEIQLPDTATTSLDAFRRFIARSHGQRP